MHKLRKTVPRFRQKLGFSKHPQTGWQLCGAWRQSKFSIIKRCDDLFHCGGVYYLVTVIRGQFGPAQTRVTRTKISLLEYTKPMRDMKLNRNCNSRPREASKPLGLSPYVLSLRHGKELKLEETTFSKLSRRKILTGLKQPWLSLSFKPENLTLQVPPAIISSGGASGAPAGRRGRRPCWLAVQHLQRQTGKCKCPLAPDRVQKILLRSDFLASSRMANDNRYRIPSWVS